jgi:hypothetical protein
MSSSPPWPLDFRCTSLHSLKSVKQTVLKILSGQYIPMSSLTSWPVTSKSIVVIYFSWCNSLQSLKSVKQRVFKILSGPYISMSNLTPWCFNLKINRGHLLFRMKTDKIFLFPIINDLDLWPTDLKINRGLPLLTTNPHIWNIITI